MTWRELVQRLRAGMLFGLAPAREVPEPPAGVTRRQFLKIVAPLPVGIDEQLLWTGEEGGLLLEARPPQPNMVFVKFSMSAERKTSIRQQFRQMRAADFAQAVRPFSRDCGFGGNWHRTSKPWDLLDTMAVVDRETAKTDERVRHNVYSAGFDDMINADRARVGLPPGDFNRSARRCPSCGSCAVRTGYISGNIIASGELLYCYFNLLAFDSRLVRHNAYACDACRRGGPIPDPNELGIRICDIERQTW